MSFEEVCAFLLFPNNVHLCIEFLDELDDELLSCLCYNNFVEMNGSIR